MKVILLGTKGGPALSVDRGSPAQLVVVGDRSFLVDCGEGTPYQMFRAGHPPQSVEAVLVTHQHSDHNGGYGNVLLSGWTSGRSRPVRTYGPPPLQDMTRAFFELNRYDIDIRVHDEGRMDLRELVETTEVTGDGVVFDDGEVRVTAAVVEHPPVEPSFAYRFDAGGRSVVFSGDTTVCDNLVRLAQGADVLVHEVIHLDLLEERIRSRSTNAAWSSLHRHLVRSHTSVTDVGQVAAAAGVTTLVLTHFVPGDTDIADEQWLDPVRRNYDGQIVLGRDLLEIEI